MATAEIHIELAVNFDEDPKMRSLLRYGPDVRGLRDLYVLMVCYCKRNLTDGFVPQEQVGLLVYPDTWENGQRDAKRLVEAGLLVEVDGGFLVVAYAKRNKTKAEVLQLAQDKAAGGTLGNHKRWHEAKGVVKADCPYCRPNMDRSTDRTTDRGANRGANRPDFQRGENGPANTTSHGDGDGNEAASPRGQYDVSSGDAEPTGLFNLGKQNPSHSDRTSDSGSDRGAIREGSPKTETETETDKKNPPTPQRGKRGSRRADASENYDSDPNFGRFWAVYPMPKGKFEAFQAWRAAMSRGDDPELIIRAAQWFRDDPERKPEATKWAQGWLNNRRYKEQRPVQPRNGPGNFWEN